MSNNKFDNIDSLPTNKNEPTEEEIKTVDSFFLQKKNTMVKIINGFKDILITAILFIILSLPQFDEIVKKFIKCSNSSIYMLILVKAIIFCIVLFLIKNFYLSQNN
jgi:hypothetical protein